MTIEQAIKTLNARRHNGAADWMLTKFPGGMTLIVSPSVMTRLSGLTEFEAVAIAEKYEADAEEAWIKTLPKAMRL